MRTGVGVGGGWKRATLLTGPQSQIREPLQKRAKSRARLGAVRVHPVAIENGLDRGAELGSCGSRWCGNECHREPGWRRQERVEGPERGKCRR